MNRRLKLIQYTFLHKTLGGSVRNWLWNVLSPPCEILADFAVTETRQEGEFAAVKIKGHDGYLYHHHTIDARSRAQILTEQMYRWNWHYYRIPQTGVRCGDIVLDCGGAEGLFAFLNHKKAKSIHVFEPLPEYLAGLEKTFAAVPNVSVHACALGDACGGAFLMRAGIASRISTERTDTAVKIDTIDHFCGATGLRPTFLKADLEGYEMNLLQGAVETIRNNRPKIAITTYHKKSHAIEIEHFLKTILPSYHVLTKGIDALNGAPVMLHAW